MSSSDKSGATEGGAHTGETAHTKGATTDTAADTVIVETELAESSEQDQTAPAPALPTEAIVIKSSD